MIVDGKKMSKSLGNYYTVRDLDDMGYSPLTLRYFYLIGHYRSQVNFTVENLKNAGNSLDRLKRIVGELKDGTTGKSSKDDSGPVNEKYLKLFEKAMDDDLDTVTALQVLWSLVRDDKASGKIKTIKKMDEVFGLDLLKVDKVKVPTDVMKLVRDREKARKDKDWKKADKLRSDIEKKGWKVDDTGEGSKVQKI